MNTIPFGTRQRKRHGKSHTPLHGTWLAIIHRTTSPKDKEYHRYGGRGISICREWWESFEDFEFYVAQLPHYGKKGYSLDRINNDGNYKPGNMRWATAKEQSRNTCRNRMLTHNGKTQPIVEWCDELGIKPVTLHSRLRRGWDTERALFTPTSSLLPTHNCDSLRRELEREISQ